MLGNGLKININHLQKRISRDLKNIIIMQEVAEGLRTSWYDHSKSGRAGKEGVLLEEIAIRLEMIYLVLRGGIDGKKEE